jgi:hypothetical protein
MNTLREEIIHAHETRSELLKWKLAIVGAIGAVGLGLAGAQTSKHADLVLAAAPLVCIYVDLLCMNLNIRMLVIASWMRQAPIHDAEQRAIGEYEAFVDRFRNAFALEDWAIDWTTRVISVAVIVYGVEGASGGVSTAFIVSGIVGVLGSFAAQIAYRRRRTELQRASTVD